MFLNAAMTAEDIAHTVDAATRLEYMPVMNVTREGQQ